MKTFSLVTGALMATIGLAEGDIDESNFRTAFCRLRPVNGHTQDATLIIGHYL